MILAPGHPNSQNYEDVKVGTRPESQAHPSGAVQSSAAEDQSAPIGRTPGRDFAPNENFGARAAVVRGLAFQQRDAPSLGAEAVSFCDMTGRSLSSSFQAMGRWRRSCGSQVSPPRDPCQRSFCRLNVGSASALEALGVSRSRADKRTKHDATRSDQNHPTRVLMLRMWGLFGFFWARGGCVGSTGGLSPLPPVDGRRDLSSFVVCRFVRRPVRSCCAFCTSRPRGSVQGESRKCSS